MEEHEQVEAMDLKCPRKLDFNKPLLSTKRLNIVVADRAQNTRDERVPFSWEKAAGKPKDVQRGRNDHDEQETPRLRLPPCLWHPGNRELVADEDYVDDDDGDSDDDDLAAHHDNDNDNDNDNDDEKFNSDVLSDAMEVFSLSEALDIVQKSEKARRKNKNESLSLKLAEDSNNGNQSPNYLIKRFLPDATALAASSALQFSKTMMMDNKICDSSSSYLEASYVASPKGCGLEVLFPWRLKHKLCAMKSPILPCSSSTNMQKQQHHNSSEQKKHQRISSQALYKM